MIYSVETTVYMFEVTLRYNGLNRTIALVKICRVNFCIKAYSFFICFLIILFFWVLIFSFFSLLVTDMNVACQTFPATFITINFNFLTTLKTGVLTIHTDDNFQYICLFLFVYLPVCPIQKQLPPGCNSWSAFSSALSFCLFLVLRR